MKMAFHMNMCEMLYVIKVWYTFTH